MTTPQIAAVVIFLAVIVAIMTEKIHRAVAATAGAVLLLLIGILDVNSAVSYIDFNTVGPDRYDAVRCSGKKFRHI